MIGLHASYTILFSLWRWCFLKDMLNSIAINIFLIPDSIFFVYNRTAISADNIICNAEGAKIKEAIQQVDNFANEKLLFAQQ